MTRHDPGAEPILRRPRRSALHGRQIKLRGERGGEATLSTPAAPGQLWHGYLGRLAARTWRPIACRRVDASHFVSVR